MKDEYIRKQDAVEAAKHAWAKGLEPSQYIESLEPADVVPVVRCRDCKRFRYDPRFDSHWCGCTLVKPDDYCSYGERREE